MSNSDYIIIGMALQAFVCALGSYYGWLELSSNQQLTAGILFCCVVLFGWFIRVGFIRLWRHLYK